MTEKMGGAGQTWGKGNETGLVQHLSWGRGLLCGGQDGDDAAASTARKMGLRWQGLWYEVGYARDWFTDISCLVG